MITNVQDSTLQLSLSSNRLVSALKGATPTTIGSNPAKFSAQYEPVSKELKATKPSVVNVGAIKQRELQPPPILGEGIIKSGGVSVKA